jgi:uncharacterized protein
VTALYLDASAFVKTVVAEPEAASLNRYLEQHAEQRVVSSALLRAEAVRAVRHLEPRFLAQARLALRRVELVGVDDQILDVAATLDPRILRTLDAIHLATALALESDLDAVVTYDQRMADGARLLGLAVASPR